jgi:hypothetical protein
MDYAKELKSIEDEISQREAQRNQLQGLLNAKRSELEKVSAEIREKFGCDPSELAVKAGEIKTELEKNITDMKAVLGLT